MWHVYRDGQICPSQSECKTLDEALAAAVILARYDQASYTVGQQVFVVVAVENTCEVRRVNNNRLVRRHTFSGVEGTRLDL